MFAASEYAGQQFTITSDYVKEKLSELMIDRDLSKFIL